MESKVENSKIMLVPGILLVLIFCGGLFAYRLFTRGPLDQFSPQRIEELRSWALLTIDLHGSNVSVATERLSIGASVPPEFGLKAPYADWSLVLYPRNTNRPSYLALQSMGGFSSLEIAVGPRDLQLPTNRYCERKAPGVYILRTGTPVN